MKKPVDSFLPPLWILTLIAGVLLFWFLAQIQEIVTMLVVGYSIAYIVDPFLGMCEKKKIPRVFGFFILSILIVLVIGVLGVTAFPTIMHEYRKLSQDLPHYLGLVEERFGPIYQEVQRRFFPDAGLQDVSTVGLIKGINPDTINTIVGTIFTTLLSGYSQTLALVNLLLLPFIVFYLAVDFKSIHTTLLGLFPYPYRKKVKAIAEDINMHVSAYVKGQLIVATILFVFYALGLGILGIQLWMLLAVISGFGSIIPYMGFLLGIILSSLMAFVTFGDFFHVLQVWMLFIAVQFLEGTFITPRIVGNKVGISPLVVILALFAGGKIFGILGIFLAIPAAAILKVLGNQLYGWVIREAR